MKCVVECPHCGTPNAIDLADYRTNDCTIECQMGPETQHWFDCDSVECGTCERFFRVTGSITEYPLGTYDSEQINCSNLDDTTL
jgi:hypothetical protein